MKKLMLTIASLFLATSVASANPQKMDFTSMNKADSQFLFDGSTKAIALSSQEMKQTEGEWIHFAIYAGHYGYRAYRSYGSVYRWSGFGLFGSSFSGWR
jgi:hypothetical protein